LIISGEEARLHEMRTRVTFQGALCLGALLAVVGGSAIGVLHLLDPDMEILKRIESGYRHMIIGFLFLTLFAVASALLDALSKKPAPAPVVEPAARAAEPAPARLAGLYHEMKTYVDLEMWELAIEKADLIVKDFAGTREADLVSRNLNELRWKAEPKFVVRHEPISADQEKQLREKGLASMYQHVKTYMDLEMWELARQKAISIMKSFPESAEAVDLMKVFDMIEKNALAAASAPAKVEEP
jgi:hypothetical protein